MAGVTGTAKNRLDLRRVIDRIRRARLSHRTQEHRRERERHCERDHTALGHRFSGERHGLQFLSFIVLPPDRGQCDYSAMTQTLNRRAFVSGSIAALTSSAAQAAPEQPEIRT